MKTAKSQKPILLTSALPYANGSIHIGHLVEYIMTDIYARALRLSGEDVIYCCADDAHGTAIEIKASAEGITPEELIAKVNKEHTTDFARFHIKFDNYHSTHSPENRELSLLIYNRLKEKGLIYTKDIESFYDEKAGRFLPDRYIKGTCPKCSAIDQYGDVCAKCNTTYKPTDLVNPYSTISGSTPVRRKTTHYFFKLSALSEKLRAYFKQSSFQPEVVNYLTNWIDEGLQDWDISRDGPYFGFPIPDATDKYFYVWLDAPIGYLASCKNYCDKHPEKGRKSEDYFFGKETRMMHVIGKDIMYFHFLFWPAMLMEAGFNLPSDILVHGFLTVNKEKMSKSRGTFLTAREFADRYEPEYLRYYYAKVLSRKLSDIDLDFKVFVESVNTELVANLSNLCYRSLSFTNKNFKSVLPSFNEKDYPVLADAQRKLQSIKAHYLEFNLNKAVSEVMELSSLGNKFFQESAPWQLLKEGKQEEAGRVCAVTTNIAYMVSVAIQPILPEFSRKLQEQLNVKETAFDAIPLLKDHTIGTASILISKIEEKKQESFLLDLKVAEVKEARLHPNSQKLVVMKIDIGEEKPRQLVAGIQKHYATDALIGKKIIVVSNMKPAKLGGELSEGMLLAASNEDDSVVKLLEVPSGKAGDLVVCGNLSNGETEIKYEDFAKLTLSTKSGKVHVKDHDAYLLCKGKEVESAVPDGYSVA